jgi:CRISP-associated protein Cas1
VSGNVFLRRQQYRCADDPKRRAALACCIVGAKIANCRTVLLRGARDSELPPVSSALSAAAGRIEHALPELAKFTGLERTRGLEGDAAKTYFASFDQLISASKDSFFFRERSRRPPLDNMNALLSFLYTLLTHDYAAALETVGLDPQVGFLHADRPGRPSLALDLMEEMRPVLADRLALSLVNRRQVQADGFQKSEAGAVLMNDEARKTVLVAYQKRKQEEVRHPFLDEKIPLGMIPFTQSLLLARHLRGDLDQYPGFFWR